MSVSIEMSANPGVEERLSAGASPSDVLLRPESSFLEGAGTARLLSLAGIALPAGGDRRAFLARRALIIVTQVVVLQNTVVVAVGGIRFLQPLCAGKGAGCQAAGLFTLVSEIMVNAGYTLVFCLAMRAFARGSNFLTLDTDRDTGSSEGDGSSGDSGGGGGGGGGGLGGGSNSGSGDDDNDDEFKKLPRMPDEVVVAFVRRRAWFQRVACVVGLAIMCTMSVASIWTVADPAVLRFYMRTYTKARSVMLLMQPVLFFAVAAPPQALCALACAHSLHALSSRVDSIGTALGAELVELGSNGTGHGMAAGDAPCDEARKATKVKAAFARALVRHLALRTAVRGAMKRACWPAIIAVSVLTAVVAVAQALVGFFGAANSYFTQFDSVGWASVIFSLGFMEWTCACVLVMLSALQRLNSASERLAVALTEGRVGDAQERQAYCDDIGRTPVEYSVYGIVASDGMVRGVVGSVLLTTLGIVANIVMISLHVPGKE